MPGIICVNLCLNSHALGHALLCMASFTDVITPQYQADLLAELWHHECITLTFMFVLAQPLKAVRAMPLHVKHPCCFLEQACRLTELLCRSRRASASGRCNKPTQCGRSGPAPHGAPGQRSGHQPSHLRGVPFLHLIWPCRCTGLPSIGPA